MQKKLADLVTKNFATAYISDPIKKLIRLIRVQRRPYVVVLDNEENYFGLINVNHLLNLQLERKSIGALKAGDICIHRTMAFRSNSSIRETAELMVSRNIEYVLTMDAGRVIGILSATMIVRELIHDLDSIPGLFSIDSSEDEMMNPPDRT